jgi:CrcB protein
LIKAGLLIFLGGGIGSLLRYGIGLMFSKSAFPWGTFVSNVISCILLGLFVGWLVKEGLFESKMKLFLVTGLCGGFSTFSTFSYESLRLLEKGDFIPFLFNIGGSIAVCLLCIYLGLKLVSII